MSDSRRDSRLDIVRGLALAIIAVNHVTLMFAASGKLTWQLPSLSTYGPSSAAELFVGLSGYMVGLVYLRKPNLVVKVLKRSRQLYLVNIAALAATVVIVFADGGYVGEFTRLYAFADSSLLSILLMVKPPFDFDVLPLYILLLLGVPFAAVVAHRSKPALIAIILVAYLGAQMWHTLSPGTTFSRQMGWVFDPLAWSLLFYGTMLLGMRKFHESVFARLEGNWPLMCLLVLLFALAFVVDRKWNSLVHAPRMDGKEALQIFRLMHSALTMLLICGTIAALGSLRQAPPFRLLAAMGRHTLQGYAYSIPITYGAACLWLRADANPALYPVLAIGTLLLTCALIMLREAGIIRRTVRRDAARAAAPSDTTVLP